MKAFSCNFKLQSVKSRTKPILVLLSLQTKDSSGSYLSVSKSIGRSIKPEDWDTQRKIPKDTKLAIQLYKIKEMLLFKMNEFAMSSDKDIITIFKTGYFGKLVEDTIKREFYGEFSDVQKLTALIKDFTPSTSAIELDKIKSKMLSANYKIVDAKGYEIDIERFFSNLDYYPDERKKLQSKIIAKPSVTIQPTDLPDDQRYAMKVWEYIEVVADKKFQRDELDKDGVTDYKKKIGARFKNWDEELTLGQLSDDVAAEFFTYLRESFDDSLNYYNNFKKWLKAVINFATDEDKLKLPNCNTKSKVYEQRKEKVFMPYFTEEMLNLLLQLEFEPHEKHLEYTRDIFFMASHTGGLTFGDLKQAFSVMEKNVDGIPVKYIRIKRNKTGIDADIPLNETSHKIIQKYDSQFKSITNYRYNKNLQAVCRKAGLVHDFVQIRENLKTKEKVKEVKPFWQLVGSHTARRNFCTNYYVHRGIPASLVMEFSQHKKLESFMAYIHATAEVKFEEFSRRVILVENSQS